MQASTTSLWTSRPTERIIESVMGVSPLFGKTGGRTAGPGVRWGVGAAAVEVWTTSPFFTSAEVGPRRQLPLRARSSTGWAGGALRYDGGLTAHRRSRAAPKCPGLPVLLFLEWFRKRFMVSCVSRRRHFVPNPVQRNYSHRPAAQRRRPQSIHTGTTECACALCATPPEELEQIIRQGGPRGELYGKLKAFRDKYADEIRRRFPKLPRALLRLQYRPTAARGPPDVVGHWSVRKARWSPSSKRR